MERSFPISIGLLRWFPLSTGDNPSYHRIAGGESRCLGATALEVRDTEDLLAPLIIGIEAALRPVRRPVSEEKILNWVHTDPPSLTAEAL